MFDVPHLYGGEVHEDHERFEFCCSGVRLAEVESFNLRVATCDNAAFELHVAVWKGDFAKYHFGLDWAPGSRSRIVVLVRPTVTLSQSFLFELESFDPLFPFRVVGSKGLLY